MIRFEQQKGFERHLGSMRSLESVFLILTQEEKERQDVAFRIKNRLLEKNPQYEVRRFAAGRDPISEILAAYQGMSLFSSSQVIEIYDVHLFSDKEVKLLAAELGKDSSDTLTILLGKKDHSEWKQLSNEMIVLDLLKEKPWDHKKRVGALLFEYIKKAGKTIAPQALDHLMELVGIDYAVLLQQVESLICFTGERAEITMQDLSCLSIMRKKQKTWQLAEYLAWGQGKEVPQEDLTDGEFLSLLIQVRFRLNAGIKLKEGINPSDISPSLVQKYLGYTARYHKEYFQKAFAVVYEIERLSRIGQFSVSFLFDMLYVKLHDLREAHLCQEAHHA